MVIRSERDDDHSAIRQILIDAFTDQPYSRQTEHMIVDALREDGALRLSLVAEMDGQVVGQIAFSPVEIGGVDSGWLGLGPVAVAPPLQRQGIGQKLVREGLAQVRAAGAKGCFLVGDPAYYQRFGFRAYPTLWMDGVPPEVVMALPFDGEVPEGRVTHHAAFSVGLE